MNEVFYSLSLGLVLFAAWLQLNVSDVLAAAIWFIGAWLIFGGAAKVKKLFGALERSSVGRSLQMNQETITLTPIDNPVLASVASQIRPTMTLEEIETFVARSLEPSRTIRGYSQPVER